MSTISGELADLFRRDLTRLVQELQAFPDNEALWKVLPGITNSGGNLTLHLEGNLREYVGRQLGQIEYRRIRPLEFSATGVENTELIRRVEDLRDLVYRVVSSLTEEQLNAVYPENVFDVPLSTRHMLIHIYSHFSYHLGQIDYLRRALTQGEAVPFVRI